MRSCLRSIVHQRLIALGTLVTLPTEVINSEKHDKLGVKYEQRIADPLCMMLGIVVLAGLFSANFLLKLLKALRLVDPKEQRLEQPEIPSAQSSDRIELGIQDMKPVRAE